MMSTLPPSYTFLDTSNLMHTFLHTSMANQPTAMVEHTTNTATIMEHQAPQSPLYSTTQATTLQAQKLH